MKHTRRKFLQLALSTEVAGAFSEFRPERLLAVDGKFVQQGETKPDPASGRNSASPQSGGTALIIDASKPAVPPQPASFAPQFNRAPGGREIVLNNQYLALDGEPWLPVMGQFPYERWPEQYWEEELLKMKAGGIQIVESYIFWIYQEEVKAQFDWSGRRDLRRFVQLCGKHGLYVFMRIGPWCDGEVRNGGFPDWLVHSCKELRKNDPCYLGYVRAYYGQIGKQLSGLYWKDGGPVIGIQIENEYRLHGPGAGAAHIVELKKIAERSGIKAPLYTTFGSVSAPGVIPTGGEYPAQFWPRSICELPPSECYFFPRHGNSNFDYPNLTAELGGGMETSYHRRPVVRADDIAAFILCKLGSGVNLPGYYMYQGGANSVGKLSTLEQSQDTVYPENSNDMPVISYDYQAPLGEFGQVRPLYGALKVYHLFLQDFGSSLATMEMRPSDTQPVSVYDRQTPRVAARSRGNRAFVFVNNYQRNYPLREQKNFQVAIKLPSETVKIPAKPITVPSGSYFIWPVNLEINGSVLKYATAQLLCRVYEGETPIYFFFAPIGIEPEFAFVAQSVGTVEASSGVKTLSDGQIRVSHVEPGTDVAIFLRSRTGKTAKIVLLTKQQAEDCYRLPFAGADHFFISQGHLFSDGKTLHLRSRVVWDLSFSVFPALPQLKASAPLREAGRNGIFVRYNATVGPRKISVHMEQRREALPLGPPKMGKQVALAPSDADFHSAAEWQIMLPTDAIEGLNELYLQVEYAGDVGRLYAGEQLLDDNFYNGTVWEIGMKRFASVALGHALNLKIFPLAKGAPVYMPQEAWPSFPSNDQIARVRKITAVPEYQVTVTAA